MSVTISRCLSPDVVNIQTHRQDLAIITIVFNPENNRLSINMENVGANNTIRMLAAAMGILTNMNAGPCVTAGETNHISTQTIGV